MNRAIKLFAGAALGLVGILAPAAIDPIRAQNSAQNLQIYWIDVEGGAATLEKGARFSITVEPVMGNTKLASTTYA